ncbi:hypothetical protein L3Q67_01815 [Saccharothrix sp. AJ9571]|nr:hypothetical protein L3Q67_01815 [Saccharothrix sp. AJ9571]
MDTEGYPEAALVAQTTIAAAHEAQGESLAVDGHEADASRFGRVVPILAATSGTGASVTAAVISDALQIEGKSVLLVDTADPVRSGLSRAARTEGPPTDKPFPSVRIRYSWRAQAVLARLDSTLPVITPSMVPPPEYWPPTGRRLDVTVADVGHDPWRVGARPVVGAGQWLRPTNPAPIPIVVARPTLPSILHAEQLMSRLEPWIHSGLVTRPEHMIVVGARRWPRVIAHAGGRLLRTMVDNASFMPHDPTLKVHGITPAVTPAAARRAIEPLLRELGLLSEKSSPRLPGPRRAQGRDGVDERPTGRGPDRPDS